jgi:membrane dipeptidase
MPLNRREFMASAGLLFAGRDAFAWAGRQPGQQPSLTPAQVDVLFARATVFDALSADERWQDPEPIFAAYAQSGVTAIHTSLANSSFAVATRALAQWQERFERWPDRLMKITRAADIAASRASGRIGVLLGFQNGTIVEDDVGHLDALYEAGTRCIQLTYNTRNLIGTGCTATDDTGLTAFGRDVVARMNQLGIVVDLSHCGPNTSRDAIAAATRPPALTHTMCRAIYDHVRAKSDDLLKSLSDKGGVTGIATLGYFVGPTPDASLDDYLRHVDHAVGVAGIDHVGLASDYSIRGIAALHTRESWYEPRLRSFPPEYRVRWPPWIAELDTPDRFRNIAHGLARRRYRSAEIEKLLGGNWARYFREVIG